jgi:hypothetical protein
LKKYETWEEKRGDLNLNGCFSAGFSKISISISLLLVRSGRQIETACSKSEKYKKMEKKHVPRGRGGLGRVFLHDSEKREIWLAGCRRHLLRWRFCGGGSRVDASNGVLPSFPSSSLTDLLPSQPSRQRAAFPLKRIRGLEENSREKAFTSL